MKRLRDIDQAACRCDRPIRPGKKGRAPNPYADDALSDSEDTALARESLGSGFRPDD